MKDTLKAHISFALPFLVMMVLGLYLSHYWLCWLAGMLLLTGLLWSKGRMLFVEYWMRLAHLLGRINAAILLTLVFVFLVIPLGLFMRRGTRLSQSLRQVKPLTAFIKRNHEFEPGNFETPW